MNIRRTYRIWPLVVGIVLLSASLACAGATPETPSASPEATQQTTPAVTDTAIEVPSPMESPTPVVTQTVDEAFSAWAKSQYGQNGETLTDAEWLTDPTGIFGSISYTIPEGWDVGAYSDQAMRDLELASKSFFAAPTFNKADSLVITADIPGTDAYGNSTVIHAYLITMTRPFAGKANWDAITYKQLAHDLLANLDGTSLGIAPTIRSDFNKWLGP